LLQQQDDTAAGYKAGLICKDLVEDQESGLVSGWMYGATRDQWITYLERLVATKDVRGIANAEAMAESIAKDIRGDIDERDRADGKSAYGEGRHADALRHFEAYASCRPNRAEAHGLKADALAALKRYPEAVSAYTGALDRIPEPDLGLRFAAHFNRGNAYAALGDHVAAVADFDSALGCAPRDRNALCNRANSKFALGRFDNASEDYKAAFDLRNGSDAALGVGNCQARLGNFSDAMWWYTQGKVIDGSDEACRHNASVSKTALEALIGDADHAVASGSCGLRVEADVAPIRLGFTGCTGNVGNVVGFVDAPGPGYPGAPPFTIQIVRPRRRRASSFWEWLKRLRRK